MEKCFLKYIMNILITHLWKLKFLALFFEELCQFVLSTSKHDLTIITCKYLKKIDEYKFLDKL